MSWFLSLNTFFCILYLRLTFGYFLQIFRIQKRAVFNYFDCLLQQNTFLVNSDIVVSFFIFYDFLIINIFFILVTWMIGELKGKRKKNQVISGCWCHSEECLVSLNHLSLAYNKKIAKDNVIVHRDRVGLVKG